MITKIMVASIGVHDLHYSLFWRLLTKSDFEDANCAVLEDDMVVITIR
jgi:hypothetical protein